MEHTQLGVSPNGRYFVDQHGKPFFYLGDTAWLLFQRLDHAEVDSISIRSSPAIDGPRERTGSSPGTTGLCPPSRPWTWSRLMRTMSRWSPTPRAWTRIR